MVQKLEILSRPFDFDNSKFSIGGLSSAITNYQELIYSEALGFAECANQEVQSTPVYPYTANTHRVICGVLYIILHHEAMQGKRPKLGKPESGWLWAKAVGRNLALICGEHWPFLFSFKCLPGYPYLTTIWLGLHGKCESLSKSPRGWDVPQRHEVRIQSYPEGDFE